MDQILDAGETSQPIDIKKYRRSLLPWWIKGFSWLFMILAYSLYRQSLQQ